MIVDTSTDNECVLIIGESMDAVGRAFVSIGVRFTRNGPVTGANMRPFEALRFAVKVARHALVGLFFKR